MGLRQYVPRELLSEIYLAKRHLYLHDGLFSVDTPSDISSSAPVEGRVGVTPLVDSGACPGAS